MKQVYVFKFDLINIFVKLLMLNIVYSYLYCLLLQIRNLLNFEMTLKLKTNNIVGQFDCCNI